MSVLTKIFIVLSAVLSVAFSMAIISFVAQVPPWKELADGYRAQRDTLESEMVHQAGSHAADKAGWLDAQRESARQMKTLRGELSDTQADVSDLRTQLAEVRAEKSDAEALARNLSGQLELASRTRDAAQQQREELQKRNTELVTRNVDLNGRVSELTTRTIALVQQQRQYEQQINILREENSKLASISRRAASGEFEVAGLDGTTPVEAVAGTPIRGRILEVDGSLAMVSIGSADGVRENMTFVIYRGQEYVGDLRITDVEPHTAAGNIFRRRGTPQVDDLVADETRFSAAG